MKVLNETKVMTFQFTNAELKSLLKIGGNIQEIKWENQELTILTKDEKKPGASALGDILGNMGFK